MRARIGPRLMVALLALGLSACSKESRPTVEEQSSTSSADAGSASAPAAEVALCEHGVPAELCTRCIPELTPVFQEQGDWCEEHGLPESHCRQCNPGLTFTAGAEPTAFPEPGTRVRLASAETEREAGIRTQRVRRQRFARTLEVVGQLEFNQNRLALLSA
ncbi:MAG TPA: efflux transporter periplasmic adaptor subunit, partial [Myxococcaceae bacterium]|nr:efflux transporter periplasmic adaptor subunit [Myxococcaceae bacterium]